MNVSRSRSRKGVGVGVGTGTGAGREGVTRNCSRMARTSNIRSYGYKKNKEICRLISKAPVRIPRTAPTCLTIQNLSRTTNSCPSITLRGCRTSAWTPVA